jgi:hypothetical protein
MSTGQTKMHHSLWLLVRIPSRSRAQSSINTALANVDANNTVISKNKKGPAESSRIKVDEAPRDYRVVDVVFHECIFQFGLNPKCAWLDDAKTMWKYKDKVVKYVPAKDENKSRCLRGFLQWGHC